MAARTSIIGITGLLFSVPFWSCSTLRVVAPEDEKLKGLPFYTKAGGCKQETVYLETTLEVTLSPKADSADKKSIFLVVSGDKRSQLRALAADLAPGRKTFDEAKAEIDGIDIYDPETTAGFLASNSISETTYVDYSKPHYINGKRPLIGSAKSEFTLASDGTLTKVSAEVSDETASTILGALPVAAYLESVLIPTDDETKLDSVPRPTLAIEPVIYSHTYTSLSKANSFPCAPETGIPNTGEHSNANYARARVEPATKGGKKNENTATFSGSVVLPEGDSKK